MEKEMYDVYRASIPDFPMMIISANQMVEIDPVA